MNLLPEIRNRNGIASPEDLLREPPLKRARSFSGGDSIAGTSLFGADYGLRPPQDLVYVVDRRQSLAYGGNLQGDGYPNLTLSHLSSSSSSAFIDRHLSKQDQLQFPGLGLELGLGLGLGFVQNQIRHIPDLKTEAQGAQLQIDGSRYKTKLCKHFIAGDCKYKDGCNFAHSIEELRKLPADDDDEGKALYLKFQGRAQLPNLESVSKSGPDLSALSVAKAAESKSQTVKTRLCKFFQTGMCKYNAECKFAHSKEELNSSPVANNATTSSSTVSAMITSAPLNLTTPAAATIAKATTSTTIASGVAASTRSSEFATTTIASGVLSSSFVKESQTTLDEFNKKEPVPSEVSKETKLKTKPCKFFQTGQCAYKDKCNFSHGEIEAAVGVVSGAAKQCKFFLQGKCHFGEKCINSHGSSDGAETSGNPKTRLCIWKEKGQSCPFGDKCVFSHSLPEVQNGTNSNIPLNRYNINTLSEMGMQLGSRELTSSIAPYSYDITDTNWRPFQSSAGTWNVLSKDLNLLNDGVVRPEIHYGISNSFPNLSYTIDRTRRF